MRKVIKSVFIFSLFLFGFILILDVEAALPCSSPGYPVCTNKNSTDCSDVGGLYVGSAGGCLVTGGATGTCCEREVETCPTGMDCYPESASCFDDGGVPANCNDGGVPGCCKVPVEVQPCPNVSTIYCGEPDSQYCTTLGTIQNCGPNGEPGCCIDQNQQRVDCPTDYSCQSISECSPSNPAYKIGDAWEENCGNSGTLGCCVPGGLDEGQEDCDDPNDGCRDISYGGCNQIPDAYVRNCGGNGAQGCCVPDAEDEEFYHDIDPPEPVEGDPINRDFMPTFFDTWNLETQTANIYNLVFPIGIFISIAMIIVAGYGYLTSTGNPDKVRAASEKLTSAVTGAVFIILSLAILKVIINSLLGSYIP